MKKKLVILSLIVYGTTLEANQDEAQHPAQIHITLNANTNGHVDQDNNIDQQARHTNLARTHGQTQHNQDLKPTVSFENYMIRHCAKASCIIFLAFTQSCGPFFIPVYCANRFIIYPLISDQPWMDNTSPEEAAKLAQEGKRKVSEPIFFPLCYHIHKALTKSQAQEHELK